VIVVLFAAVAMLVLAVVMAAVLGWAKDAFHVEVDPRVDQINEALPDANCGACGFAGCNDYSEAVVAGKAQPNLCPVGGSDCAEKIAEIMGLSVEESLPIRAIVHCGASVEQRLKRHEYRGEKTCAAATKVAGLQGCMYGCMGFGDCVVVCDYDAIHIIDGLAVVDYEKCIGCGVCAKACPRGIIEMIDYKADEMMQVACSSKDAGKAVKSVCQVGCIGCKGCDKRSDLFKTVENLAGIDYECYNPDTFEDARLALEKCPTNCIVMSGKNTDPPQAVKQ